MTYAPIPHAVLDRARGASFLQALQQLDLKLKRSGHELVGPCPQCGGTDRFSIYPKKQVWNCRACRKGGGDALSLIMHARGLDPQKGDDFREAVEELADERIAPALKPPAPVAKPKDDDERNRRIAASIVRELRPLAGTPGEAYLREARKIDIAAIADVLAEPYAIGWHPSCYFGQSGHRLNGRRLGAIVAIMTDPVTAALTGGISRTYLHEGQKIGKAKSLGPAGVTRVSPDDEVTHGLHLAEGLETALDRMAHNFRPMWSCGSTTIMAKFPVLGGVEALTIFADHDENKAGENAALEAAQRWREAGRWVLPVMPPEPGDFNDVSMRGARS